MHRAAKDKTDKRFCVVSFPDEEESLYIVSSKWLQRDRLDKRYVCSWPPYKGDARIKRAVLEDERPVSTWHTCSAKLIKKCKSYKGAENILNAIVTVSNERSRLLLGNHRDSTSSHHASASKRIKTEHDVSLPGVYDCDPPSDSSSEGSSSPSAAVIYEVPEMTTSSCLPSPPISSIAGGNGNSSATSTYQFLLEATSVADQSSEMTSSSQEESYSSCTSLEEKIDYIAKSVESLKKTVEKNSEILNGLHQDASGYCPNDMQNLPLQTVEDLTSLNEKLTDDKEFTFFVKQLGFLGGKDQSDAVRRVLSRLIANDVALNLNWIGGDRKRSIQEFKRIIQLVFVAVRQNKQYSDTSQAMVEDCMKRWLRYAADRNGGRMKRIRRDRTRIVFA